MRMRMLLPLGTALVALSGCAVYTPYGHRGGQVYGNAPAVIVRPAPIIIGPAPVIVRPAYRGGTRHDRDGDGRSNRHDRDMDGDGSPNRYDRWPSDPRRW